MCVCLQKKKGVDVGSKDAMDVDEKNEAAPNENWEVMRSVERLQLISSFEFAPGTLIMLEKRPEHKKPWLRNAIKENFREFVIGDIVDAKAKKKYSWR